MSPSEFSPEREPEPNDIPEAQPENAAVGPTPTSEDQALAIISQPNVSADTLSALSRDRNTMKSRKVALALTTHARTPRHVSIPLLRRMFTFDLMQISVTPVVAADLKRAAEDHILLRLESLSIGEKTSLARRASGRIAAQLLQEADERVSGPALDNPQLTEPQVVQALMKPLAPALLFASVGCHPKWSQRREAQIALLRSDRTPLDVAAKLMDNFSPEVLREILPPERIEHLLTIRTRPQ